MRINDTDRDNYPRPAGAAVHENVIENTLLSCLIPVFVRSGVGIPDQT